MRALSVLLVVDNAVTDSAVACRLHLNAFGRQGSVAASFPHTPKSATAVDAMRAMSLHSLDSGQFGTCIPAMAVPKSQPTAKPEPVLLFFGIIDFLQEYTLRKKLEHAAKAAIHPSQSKGVSVADPHAYAKRFMRFMEQVFVESAE